MVQSRISFCERNLVGGEARLLLMLLVLLLRGSLHKGLLACPRRHWVAVLHAPLPKSAKSIIVSIGAKKIKQIQ